MEHLLLTKKGSAKAVLNFANLPVNHYAGLKYSVCK